MIDLTKIEQIKRQNQTIKPEDLYEEEQLNIQNNKKYFYFLFI